MHIRGNTTSELDIERNSVKNMFQESFTLYKLIVLYMLDKVSYPLTHAQVSSFVLDKGYTNYLTLQQVIAELTENKLITQKRAFNRTQLLITKEGQDTVQYFGNRISDAIKTDIKQFFTENNVELKDEVSIQSNYDKSATGEYDAYLYAKDKGIDLMTIKISVPTEAMAKDVCENWQKRNQEIYKKMTELLF